MKKHAKRLSLILMLALVITSFEFMSVFAVTGTTQTGETAAVPTAEELAVTGFRAEAGYNAVILKWDANAKATKFVVTGPGQAGTVLDKSVNAYAFSGLDPLTPYQFSIKAVYEKDGTTVEGATVSAIGQPVRSARYKLEVKSGGTLRRHAGRGPKKYALKTGTIYADRFQTGKYIFDYMGSTFYISRTRVGKKSLEYASNGFNYTRAEAENYVNGRGLTSRTGVLVWVSTYCQHVYFMYRDVSGWVCIDDWECSTGLASTPTPTGINGLKSIHQKIKSKNGIKWWSTFNGNAALHGRKKGKQVGKPASNGCVRNPDEKANLIYKFATKKSTVLIN